MSKFKSASNEDSAMRVWSEAELRQKLSARQYEVLTLVARHLSSKEIGAQLGLSYKTIDNHVADLMVKLAVSSRSDAARILLDAAEDRERLPSASERLDIGAPDPAKDIRPVEDTADKTHPIEPAEARSAALSLLQLPPVGGSRHDLTVAQRLAMMGQVALVSIAGLAAVVTIMVGVLSLLGR